MFSGLEDVDWPSMKHAYGSAGEVPALRLTVLMGTQRARPG
jgi:hypothetical protein